VGFIAFFKWGFLGRFFFYNNPDQCSQEPRSVIWSVVCASYSRMLHIAIVVGLLRNTMVSLQKNRS